MLKDGFPNYLNILKDYDKKGATIAAPFKLYTPHGVKAIT